MDTNVKELGTKLALQYVNLQKQPLSFEVTITSGKTITFYNVAPANWQFGQTFEGNVKRQVFVT
jgi:hypothetical protein